MRKQLLSGIILGLLFFACQSDSKKESAPLLEKRDVEKFVLIGGTLIANMENHAFLEAALYKNYPTHPISLRNIGWPADDIFGLARSQFGSAQNTRSWQPPTAEEGFGSKVLYEHIERSQPKTLLVGYGSETAYFQEEKEMELFKSGYLRLIEYAEKKGMKLILLSPPRQEAAASTGLPLSKNKWLMNASNFIQREAQERGHVFVDLYEELITNPREKIYTHNGVQLNAKGYQKMANLILEAVDLPHTHPFQLTINEAAEVTDTKQCEVSDWAETVNGVSFSLLPQLVAAEGRLLSKAPVAVMVNGKLVANSQDTLSIIKLYQDSLKEARLIATIKEKNRLHRYRLRPLNEAYIYLFRRHEMGHLAYEMEELDQLVEEKEREISRLLTSQRYDVEIELIKPWSPPKNYPEDEVPAFVPAPSIADEISSFKIAKGFDISLFAADPMIANPINVNWDTKGRAWVATSSTYPHIVPGREPNDRIIILEDTDQDGVADKHTVFADNLLVPHSVMPVKGGAYVAATTELLFFADHDGDDVADERRVIYDGFGNADVHHMIHGFRWTPWGDLHFTQSIYINSFLETPYGTRILNGSGTWAFRPETERLEIFSRGLINPWGEAFDEWGQAFATDGAGSSGISYIFPESAHATAVGAPTVLRGLNSNTPKNTAAEVIYSRHFPTTWQGSIITNDFRANRTVRYAIQPKDSGYESEEVQTVLQSDHRSYRPVDSKIGPDGALYIVDWYNPIIDHGEVDFYHPIRDKKHGRIWKLTNTRKDLLGVPTLATATPQELLAQLKSPEQFTRIQANRAFVMQEGDPQLVINWIKELNRSATDFERHRLEGLWLLAALNQYEPSLLREGVQSKKASVRAASVRLVAHYNKQEDYLKVLEKLVNDAHPQVRLETLHALRALGTLQAADLASQVLQHPMDDNLEFALALTLRTLKDQWLPALDKKETVFGGEANKQIQALISTEDPRILPHLLAVIERPSIDKQLAQKAWNLLAKIGDNTAIDRVLQKAIKDKDVALLTALVRAPQANAAIPTNTQLLGTILSEEEPSFRKAGLQLAGRWKAKAFTKQVVQTATNSTDMQEKIAAYRAMVQLDLLKEVQAVAQSKDGLDNQVAATAVWIEEDTKTAASSAVALLATLTDTKLAEVLFTTFRRLEDGPKFLEEALEGKSIPEPIASVGLKMVQTSGLNLVALEEALRQAGDIQAVGMELSKAEKEQLIAEALSDGNTRRGRAIYRRKELLCATCHRIKNIGGLSGPDLTTVGSYMTPNSLLESILQPNSDIKQNYETILLTKSNGEIVSGLLHRKTNTATLIRQANSEIIEIPAEEISEVDVSPVSLMPTGLTRNLHRDELRDLLAYMIKLGK